MNQKGPRWIADQIIAAFEASRGELVPAGGRLSRVDVEEVVEEALDRLEPPPPAPPPRSGRGE